jgi:lysophospholipase L1-like esterase
MDYYGFNCKFYLLYKTRYTGLGGYKLKKNIIWYVIIVISSISAVFITAGFVEAMHYTIGNTGGNTMTSVNNSLIDNSKKQKNDNSINILIIGDSIAKGTGDEKSKGIDKNLSEQLKNNTSKDIVIENVGIDGYKSSDLLSELKNTNIKNSIDAYDFIIVSIGGNDLREVQKQSGVLKEAVFRETKENYEKNFKDIFSEIRKSNKNAVIVCIGLYNPIESILIENTPYIDEWNKTTEDILKSDEKTIFISTFDIFKFNTGRFIAKDNLHPNSIGYQTISYLISKSVESLL